MPTSAIAATEDQSTARRYESLIRIAAEIRAQQEPRELFGILVHELGQVVHFDGIAQYDEASNKIDWYLCPNCAHPGTRDIDKDETIAAWVFRHQETVVLGTLDGPRRVFPHRRH